MTQVRRSRQSLNGQGVHKIPKKLRSKKPNIGLNVRVRSWNLGSISGSARTNRRWKVDMCCLQEVRWRGQETRFMGVKRGRYKFW